MFSGRDARAFKGERSLPLEVSMSLGTIVIIALVVLFLGGGGFYWSRR
jgi:hypothetical protein